MHLGDDWEGALEAGVGEPDGEAGEQEVQELRAGVCPLVTPGYRWLVEPVVPGLKIYC